MFKMNTSPSKFEITQGSSVAKVDFEELNRIRQDLISFRNEIEVEERLAT